MLSKIEKVFAALIDKEYHQTLFRDLRLFQRKGNGFIACCPFHDEPMPTLLIYGDRPEYFCFACSDRGDWIRYLMNKDLQSYLDALKVLQEASGIALDDYCQELWEDDLYWSMALEAALESFVIKLWSNPGEEALGYLYERGYAMGEVKGMSLGYYPGFEAMKKELISQGFDCEKLGSILSRKWNMGEDIPGIAIPYRDSSGRLMSMVRKDFRTEGPLSYSFLTAEKLIEDSPFLMYRSRSQEEVLVVQGFFDALLLDQARLKPVIGIGDRGMSPSHMATACFFGIKRFILVLTGDARQECIIRDVVRMIVGAGLKASVLPVPSKFRDLDEYIRKTCLDHFKALLKKTVPAEQWLEGAG